MLDEIAAFTNGRLPQAVAFLKEMVDIPTGVANADGHARCIKVVEREWVALGFAVEQRQTLGGPVLLARRSTAGPRRPVVLFLAHIDTVFQADDTAFQSDGANATGPGVADMKGGVAVSLEVVRALDKVGAGNAYDIVVLVNSDEESSSPHSRSLIEEMASGADLVMVFEPARPDGAIVKARRGLRRYRVSVQGLAAHAGVEPEKGASAIDALARKVVALQDLNGAKPDLSVNVGTIHGGSNPNVVPESAVAEIDVRMSSPQTAEWFDRRIREIAGRSDVPGTSARCELYAERPPMVENAAITPILNTYARTAERLGLALTFVATGGGSDGNFTAALGKPTLDGLGPVGGGYHSERESVVIQSLAERAALTAGVLAALAEEDERDWLGVAAEPDGPID